MSFLLGSLTQGLIFAKLFNSNFLNHTNGILEKTKSEFKAQNRMFGGYLERSPLVWMRGGLIGCFTLTMNERVVDWMERNREEITRKRTTSELLDF